MELERRWEWPACSHGSRQASAVDLSPTVVTNRMNQRWKRVKRSRCFIQILSKTKGRFRSGDHLTKESCRTATWKGRVWKQSTRILLKLLILIESPSFFPLGPGFMFRFPQKDGEAVCGGNTSTKKTPTTKGGWLNNFCKVTHRYNPLVQENLQSHQYPGG